MLEGGADFKAKNLHGRTPLYKAAMDGGESMTNGKNHEAAMRQLIEKGADMEESDEDGKTALHLAAEKGH